MGFDLYGKNPKNENGEYFRQNVWGWRPIWEYVCSHHSDIVDTETQKQGNYNSSYIVSEDIATKLGNDIHIALQDGTVAEFVNMVKERVAKAKEHNEKLEFHFELLKLQAIEISGNEHIAPTDYPNGLDKQWQFLYSLRNRYESYPTDVEDIAEFQRFCLDSGGFEIS